MVSLPVWFCAQPMIGERTGTHPPLAGANASGRLPPNGFLLRVRVQWLREQLAKAPHQRICAVVCHQAVVSVDDAADLRLMRRQNRLAERQGPLRQAAVLAFPGRNNHEVASRQKLFELGRRKITRKPATVRETRNRNLRFHVVLQWASTDKNKLRVLMTLADGNQGVGEDIDPRGVRHLAGEKKNRRSLAQAEPFLCLGRRLAGNFGD